MNARKTSNDVESLLQREARKRAECMTSKKIAELTGYSETYIAQRIARIRRDIEISLHVEQRIVDAENVDGQRVAK